MKAHDLKEFRDRCVYAMSHGFGVAKADEYADALVKLGASRPKVKHLTAEHLLAMCDQVGKEKADEAPEELDSTEAPAPSEEDFSGLLDDVPEGEGPMPGETPET